VDSTLPLNGMTLFDAGPSMPKRYTTHREILRGMLVAAPIAAVFICVVWFVAVGTAPSAIVWELSAVVFCVYLAIAAVAWINARIASRRRPAEPRVKWPADGSAEA
jgi:small-conductance mechanosensitive channel